MMVSAVSGSGAVPDESGDGRGRDEDGFASILASLVSAPTSEASGAMASVTVGETGESIVGASAPDTDVTPTVDEADPETSLPAGDAAMPLTRQADEEHAAPRVDASVVDGGAASEKSDMHGTEDETPILAGGGRSAPPLDTPVVGEVGPAVISNAVPIPMEAAVPAASETATPVSDSASDAWLPVASGRVSGDSGGSTVPPRFDIEPEPVLEVQVEDLSSPGVEESIGPEVVDDAGSPGPSLQFEPRADHASPATAQAVADAPGDVAPDSVTGADTDARVEAIREVVEWLEGVGLESTPGEMRVEIPDVDGELIVRVAVVDGRLEVDASGSESSLPERWLDDLRRELDARGFGFAEDRQGREEHASRRDDSGSAAGASTTRQDRSARPGVLL